MLKHFDFRNLSLLVVIAMSGSAKASDWVTGGGNPERNGIADVLGPSAPNVLWQGSLNSSFGQQVFIWQDKVVTYRDNFSTSLVVCQRLATGETLWTRDFPGTGDRSLPVGFRDSAVYVVDLRNSGPDTLYALNPEDGSVIWKSRYTVSAYITESISFAENGDLIFALEGMTTGRINRLTGDTVWTTPRVWPVSGSADVTVHGTRFYCFGGALVGGSLRVYALDVATGHKRCSTFVEDTHPGGTAPYGNIMVGSDGVLHAHRCGDNVTAIEDQGESLHVRWIHEVSLEPYAPFAQLACGPDSSVYALSSGRIVRLDPQTGVALDSSPYIKDSNAVFAAHLAVGVDGTVYATNGGYADGALFAFTPDLHVIWVDSISNVSTSNPAIGRNGELAIAGGGTTMRVYLTASALAGSAGDRSVRCPSAFPNPFRSDVTLRVSGAATVVIRDAAGRVVSRLPVRDGRAEWPGLTAGGRRVPAGVYFASGPGGVRPSRIVKAE